ncbi:MAG: hypothetical protein KDE24_16505 [Caldilinea sp.]|nr:hypothetical protein [Caldilinea sp.]
MYNLSIPTIGLIAGDDLDSGAGVQAGMARAGRPCCVRIDGLFFHFGQPSPISWLAGAICQIIEAQPRHLKHAVLFADHRAGARQAGDADEADRGSDQGLHNH